MDNITRFYSRLTKAHFIGIGVMLLVAITTCIGLVVSHNSVGSSSKLSPSFQHFKEKLARIDHAVQWKKYTADNVSLQDAFVGGIDENDASIYVCRVVSRTGGDEVLPGTYIAKTRKCLYTFGTRSYDKDEYEILTTKDPNALIWLRNSYGEVQNGAIVAGLTYTNDELYIARVDIYGYYHSIGKIHDRYESAYVPDDGVEYEIQAYEVLCLNDFAL